MFGWSGENLLSFDRFCCKFIEYLEKKLSRKLWDFNEKLIFNFREYYLKTRVLNEE